MCIVVAETIPADAAYYTDKKPEHAAYDDLIYDGSSYIPDFLEFNSVYSYSYLCKHGKGYYRIKLDRKGVTVMKYNADFKRTEIKKIKKELSGIAGFYEGKSYYYLVFSQSNYEENNSKEVLRVVKYNKKWKRLGAASIKGQNAVHMGDFGMDACEYGGYLFIHTAHSMYKTSFDGLNHEANYVAKIRISDMKFIESTAPDWTCSHSFQQHITVDDAGNVVLLNKGDYSGASVLGTFQKKAKEKDLFYDPYFGVFSSAQIKNPYNGGDGVWGFENYVYHGGIEYSSKSYLTTGSSLRLDKNWEKNKVSNVFLTITPRNKVTREEVYIDYGDGWGALSRPFTKDGKATTIKWLTNYKEGSKISCSKPILLKINNNKFLVMWSQIKTVKSSWSSYTTDRRNVMIESDDAIQKGKITYVIIDGKGNIIKKARTVNGYLSDCKPILNGNTVTWFYTPFRGPTKFVTLDINKGKAITKSSISPMCPQKTSFGKIKTGKKEVTLKWKKAKSFVKGYQIQYSTNKKFKSFKSVKSKGNIIHFKTIKKLKSKKKFYFRIRSYNIIKGKTYYSEWSKTKAATIK